MTETKTSETVGNPDQVYLYHTVSEDICAAMGRPFQIVVEYLDDRDIGIILQFPFDRVKGRVDEIFRRSYVENPFFPLIGKKPSRLSDYVPYFRCKKCSGHAPYLYDGLCCGQCNRHCGLRLFSPCYKCGKRRKNVPVNAVIFRGARLYICQRCGPPVPKCHFSVAPEIFGKCNTGPQPIVHGKWLKNGDLMTVCSCINHNGCDDDMLFDISTTQERCLVYKPGG